MCTVHFNYTEHSFNFCNKTTKNFLKIQCTPTNEGLPQAHGTDLYGDNPKYARNTTMKHVKKML